jgi:hypothetical protein
MTFFLSFLVESTRIQYVTFWGTSSSLIKATASSNNSSPVSESSLRINSLSWTVTLPSNDNSARIAPASPKRSASLTKGITSPVSSSIESSNNFSVRTSMHFSPFLVYGFPLIVFKDH